MQKVKNFLKLYSLPILTGILLGTSYIPFFPWALPFCLVPLWYFWFKNYHSTKRLLISGWLSQFIFNMIGFHWVAHTANQFGGFPLPVGIIIMVLFCAIAHLYYPIAGALWGFIIKKFKLNPTRSLLMIPLVLGVCESLYPTIFFWHLGYPWLWANFPGAHMAEWIGFYGLQIITLFINLSILAFVLFRKYSVLVFALLLAIFTNSIGYYLKSNYEKGSEKMRVLLVQANIGNAIKVMQDRGSHFDDYILNKYMELTAHGLKESGGINLIVWPETAYPSVIRQEGKSNLQHRLEYFIQAQAIPLLTGAYELDIHGKTYNSMILFNERGEIEDGYRKTFLLAFGEYFPGSDYLPQLKTWFPMVSDFGRGTGEKIIKYKHIGIGAQICYESLFDKFSGNLYDQGAQLIVNVTNDSWFGYNFEPYQHLYMTMARAIEFRIPLVRATNTGISTAMTAAGVMKEFSPLHEEWAGVVEINYKKESDPTIYSYYAGQWLWILLAACGLVLFGGSIVPTRKS